MRVRDVMTVRPVTADVDTPIHELARRMKEADCGEIPILDQGRMVGVVTDRDITCRAVAGGLDPLTTPAREIMTVRPARIGPDKGIRYAIRLMEQMHVRRLPVVDAAGAVIGILSMTDIALAAPFWKAGLLLRHVSARPVESKPVERGPEVFPPY